MERMERESLEAPVLRSRQRCLYNYAFQDTNHTGLCKLRPDIIYSDVRGTGHLLA
jgi:hypothetical protein